MGIKMLSILQRSALIVVPKSDLVEQWSARLMEYTNVRRDQIGYAGDGKCDWEGKDIVIGLIHTVAMNRWGKDFRKYFGVVLFDECDSSIPPATFSPAVSMFSAKYRIGMTASATRTDGMHKVFEEHLCQHRLVCKKSKTMAPTVIMHYYHGSSGIIPEFIEAAMSRRGILISKLASNPERNKLIAAYAQKSYERARPTLVISDRKEQLKALWDLLVCTHNIPKSEIGYYVRTLDGKTIKKKDKERIANDCTIILGTYGMIRRGTDIQRLSTLILATPQSDLRQTQGRIERFLEGKQKPIVVDIVDSFYRECILSSRQRLKHYKYNGLTIKKRGLNED
jgi:superfamily II DNA or RNA helicase